MVVMRASAPVGLVTSSCCLQLLLLLLLLFLLLLLPERSLKHLSCGGRVPCGRGHGHEIKFACMRESERESKLSGRKSLCRLLHPCPPFQTGLAPSAPAPG